MSDVTTQEDINNLSAELSRLSGSIGGYADYMDKSRKAAEGQLKNDLRAKDKMKSLTGAISELTASSRSAGDALDGWVRRMAVGSLFAAAVHGIAKKGFALTETYQKMANQGHLFSGSLLELSIAAGKAGMPLEDFAAATEHASTAAKSLGKDWPLFQRQMRKTMLQHGNYGMSVEALTQFSTIHLNTMFKARALEGASSMKVQRSMNTLAQVTQGMSNITGVASSEIAKLASNALESSMAMTRVAMLPTSLRLQATEQMQVVTSILAGAAGEAGSFLSEAFAQTLGAGGLSQFTSQGQTLISAGLGGLAGKLNDLSKNQTIEGTVETMQEFRSEIGRNLPMLHNLALGTGEGAEAAKKMLKVYEGLPDKITASEIRRMKDLDGVTKFFNTIGTIWNQIIGDFKVGFMNGLKPFFKATGDITKSKTVERLGALMGQLGKTLGGVLGWILSEDNIHKIGNAFSSFVGWLVGIKWEDLFKSVGNTIIDFGKWIGSVDWKATFQTLGALFSIVTMAMAPFAHAIKEGAKLAAKYPKTAATILGALGSFLVLKKLLNFSGVTNINAAVVNVNGLLGGAGGGLLDLIGGGGKAGKGSKAARLAAINAKRAAMGKSALKLGKGAGILGKLGLGGAAIGGGILGKLGMKEAGKIGAKGIGKSIAKKIPLLGWVSGLGFGAARAMKGDWLGAGGEVLSGIAGSVPGYGTAISLGLDAALLSRDLKNAGGAKTAARPAAKPGGSAFGRWGKIAAIGGGAIGAGAIGAMAASSLLGEEGAPATVEDPIAEQVRKSEERSAAMLKALRDNVVATKEQTDVLMRTQQSQGVLLEEHSKLLREIRDKP